jgi:EspG family
MADRFEFTLDSVEAAVVGRAVHAEVRRFPLRIRNSTIDPVRFARLAVLVYDELERRGLSVGGTLHPSVRTALELFTEHQVSVSVTGRDERANDIAMLAISDGARAVAVTQAPGADDLRFSLFADEDLVTRIAGFLPSAPAAPTGTLTVEHRPAPTLSAMAARRLAQEEAEAQETDAFGNLDVVASIGPKKRSPQRGRSDAERLGELLAGRRLGGGFLAVTGLRRSGERRTAPPLGWVDTEQGRFLVETSTGANGATVATYQPAGAPELYGAVKRVISSVY